MVIVLQWSIPFATVVGYLTHLYRGGRGWEGAAAQIWMGARVRKISKQSNNRNDEGAKEV
jgi:hypothetical protein